MAEYSFITVWRVEAPIEQVWEAISHPSEWPSWWRGVEQVTELALGNENGLGARHRYTWKSRLPYRLTLEIESVEVDRPHRLVGIATGDLTGRGCWTLSESDGLTTAQFDWNVRTTKPWMNVLAPLLRPAFAWNHDIVMRWGGESLARRLGTRLVSGLDGTVAGARLPG
jgi:uncharacterized protein YndB with AHSA1/START domain